MPAKKIKYTNRIPFFPNNTNNCLNDNSEESKDEDIPEEPEHFKYGVYLNDGYDYMRHMVSLDEFFDEEKDLKKLTNEKKHFPNILKSSKTATVIKEFEVDDESSPCNALEKLKEIAKNDIDRDILKALEYDEEYSDLEDNFVELADDLDVKPVIKGDQELFNLFLGNVDTIEEDFEKKSNNDSFKSINTMGDQINEISEYINFENVYNQTKNFDLNYDSKSNRSKMSKCFINALERSNADQEKNNYMYAVSEENDFNKYIYKGETEYIEEDIDDAVDKWAYKKPANDNISVINSNATIKKNLPKIMTITNNKSTDKTEPMEAMEEDDEENLTFTDVSKYHVPRQKNETSDERKNRKNALKVAKRCRREEKKISRTITKCLKL